MFKGTGITALDLFQDHQSALKNKRGNFYEADLQKVYAWAQLKDYDTLTIVIISRQIRRKL